MSPPYHPGIPRNMVLPFARTWTLPAFPEYVMLWQHAVGCTTKIRIVPFREILFSHIKQLVFFFLIEFFTFFHDES